MHMTAIVEMTVIDIEFAYQVILVVVGYSVAEVSGQTGTRRSRGHREYQSGAKSADGLNSGMGSLISHSLFDRPAWVSSAFPMIKKALASILKWGLCSARFSRVGQQLLKIRDRSRTGDRLDGDQAASGIVGRFPQWEGR
jgi:hypothetical protein